MQIGAICQRNQDCKFRCKTCSFFPVKSQDSPMSEGGRNKNLTGTSRKVKDSAADLHNLIQKWAKYNNEGSGIVSEIANVKIQNMEKTEEDDHDENKTSPSPKMPDELDELCTKLTDLIHKMEKVVQKMEIMIQMYGNLSDLELHQMEKEGKKSLSILFQTWTITEFKNTTSELHSMYQKELQLKQAILENVCHTDQRSVMMFYTAAWVHQPYIPDTSKLLLDSMLIETGHR